MCKTRKDTLAATPRRKPRTPARPSASASASVSGSPAAGLSTSFPTTTSDADVNTAGRGDPPAGSSSSKPSSSSTSSGLVSIGSLREFLPEPPNLYDFSEICTATNNFLGKRLSSTTSHSWRCTLRGKDAVVFQRRFRGKPAALRRRLAASSKIHHNSIVRLLGAALGGDYIYLAYEHVHGASLANCLRNPLNPAYTPLAAWVDRMQVATDLAQGLQYIHHFTATAMAVPSSMPSKSDVHKAKGASRRRPVHSRIKSSSVMITETQHRAKICHFGAAELAGEISISSDSEDEKLEWKNGASEDDEIYEIPENPPATPLPSKLQRSGSHKLRFEGTRGYIAPEIRDGGSPTQKSDVFAFGVVLLELLTGQEPLKYKYNKERREFERASLIETAREAMVCEEEEAEEDEGEVAREPVPAEERHQRLRRWLDRRLNDSFPVEVAERAARLALECVRTEADRRPDMVRVAGKLSRLLLQSRAWAEKLGVPAEFTVSMAPR